MKRLRVWLLRAVLIALPALASAQQTGIWVQNAWSRAVMQGGVGVVYLTIVNGGGPDRLVGATSPVAAKVEIHESFVESGVAKMRGVTALPIEPGKPVSLAPGGYHMMLMGLNQSLAQGDVFPIVLDFETAGRVAAAVIVQAAGSSAPTQGRISGMHMEGLQNRDGTFGKAP